MKKIFLLILLNSIVMYLFSQTTNIWLQKTSLPAPSRIGAVAFVIGDKGYVGTGEDSIGNLLNDFWKYDPSIDSWSRITDFPGSARKYAVSFVANGKGYVGTGYDDNMNLTDFYSYDPSMDLWTEVDSLGINVNTTGRREASAFSINNNGYVITGYDGTSHYNNDTWQYNETLDTSWNEQTAFPGSGRRWSIGFSISETGYIGLGFSYSQDYKNDFWKYDAASNTWALGLVFPGAARAGSTSFVINSYAFVGTGYNLNYLNDFYSYNADSNSWSPIAIYPGGQITEAVGFAINGKGYVCCGRDSIKAKNELWEYTPDSLVGMNELSLGSQLFISPNPATDFVVITSLVEMKNTELKLYSITGKIICEEVLSFNNSDKLIIPINTLSSGVYFIELKSGDKIFVKKFIKE